MNETFTLSVILAMFVGLSAGYIGSLIVLKRMALVGDALSHVALPGLALGILFNFNPFLGAFVFLFASAILTWYVERVVRLPVESVVGVLFVTALALGILMIPQEDLLEALFGDIAKITTFGAVLAIVVSAVVIYSMKVTYNKLVLATISEELAVSRGINVAKVNLVYLFLVSIVVAIGVSVVGTLLVGALVVIPAVAAKIISPNLSRYTLLSSIFGLISASVGVILASYTSLPAGPMAIFSGLTIFVACLVARSTIAK
jgi:ABC-type Mn2+/Zn2+ transport system permease subunit